MEEITTLSKARKIGGSLVVTIPKSIVEEEGIVENQAVKIDVKKIKKSGLADKTILGNLGDKYQAIKRYKPDIICLGYDQKFFVRGLKKKLGEFNLKAKVIRLKSYKPEIYK